MTAQIKEVTTYEVSASVADWFQAGPKLSGYSDRILKMVIGASSTSETVSLPVNSRQDAEYVLRVGFGITKPSEPHGGVSRRFRVFSDRDFGLAYNLTEYQDGTLTCECGDYENRVATGQKTSCKHMERVRYNPSGYKVS